jgi:hypothetical protein
MNGSIRRIATVLLAAMLVGAFAGVPARAAGPDDEHSANMTQLAEAPIHMDGEELAQGSDLAFKGNLVIAGSYQGMAIFRILAKAPYVKQISWYPCPASQGDVSVLGHYVFISVNSGSSNTSQNPVCNNTDQSVNQAGIRVVDISDPTAPRQVNFVVTDCGSHTHTLVPDGAMTYIYVESYPLGVQTQTCSVASHRKISVIGFPTKDPMKAKVVSTPDVTPEIGCHDISVMPSRHLAAVACIGESQLWDIKDPAHPVVLSRIYNPSIMIHHSAAITWDGKMLAIGDEFLGSITGECLGNQHSPSGALWFYDITDPSLPLLAGYYNVPRTYVPESTDESYIACTTHNYNILPMKDRSRYIAAVAYRSSGISVVDFSDPANPKEIGYYAQLNDGKIPDPWCAYWYNGRIYTNDLAAERGVSVYELKGTGAADVDYWVGDMNPQTQSTNFR